MTHDQILQNKVGQVQTRIRLLLAQQWLCVGLTWAFGAGLLLVAATKLRWWTDAQDYLWALLAAGAVAGLLIGWTRRITPLVAAQIADERGGLKERLSTAVEITARESRSGIGEAQVRDAAEHASSMEVGQVLPWRIPPQWKYAAAGAAILAAAIIIPDLPIFHSQQEKADREAMKAEGERILQVAKAIEKQAKSKKDDENAQIVRKIAQNMKQLGKDQSRNRISKKQAMLQMNELTKQLKDAENKLTGGKAEKAMDKVASDLLEGARKANQAGSAEAAKALRQMAENVQKRDFEAAKRQLEEMARKMQAGKMGAEEMKQAAETLEQMAQSMSGSGLDQASQQMKDAAKQLQQGAEKAKQLQQQMANAKTDAEKQEIQQQIQQALQQGSQQGAEQTAKAGGT